IRCALTIFASRFRAHRVGWRPSDNTHLAQIALPSAVVRAVVSVDRRQQADDPIDQTAPDAVCSTVAARTSQAAPGPLSILRHTRTPRSNRPPRGLGVGELRWLDVVDLTDGVTDRSRPALQSKGPTRNRPGRPDQRHADEENIIKISPGRD